MNKMLAAFVAALLTIAVGTACADVTANSGSASDASAGIYAPINGGTTTTNINSGETKIPPMVSPGPTPSMPNTAQIFSQLNAPASVTGIPLIQKYLDECQPVATREHELADEYSTGASGRTQVVWSPNQAYYNTAKADQSSETVKLLRQRGKYHCLGVLTVSAQKPETVFTTVVADARIYPLRTLKGHKHVVLLSLNEAAATALGVTTNGRGLSLGSGILGLASNMLTGGHAGIGYTGGSGDTYADAKIGDTFLVLEPDPNGMEIDPGAFSRAYRPDQPQPQNVSLSLNTAKVLSTKGKWTKVPKKNYCGELRPGEDCVYLRNTETVVTGGKQGNDPIPVIQPQAEKK